MKLKVVSGAQVKLFRTRKAQYLAQALTLGVTNASGPGIPQPNFVSRNEQRDITALGRSLVIFSFGNVAYGFFIQFAECLPWRAGSCFRADALQSKVASLDFDFVAFIESYRTCGVDKYRTVSPNSSPNS